MPSTSKSPLKSALPASVNVEAISTAPSMSTTSRLAVPLTSIAPSISRLPGIPTTVVPVAIVMTSASASFLIVISLVEPWPVSIKP